MRLNVTRPFIAFLGDRLDLTPDQEEIALYGLQTLLYPVVTSILICLAGWLLGCLAATAEAALTVLVLRCFMHGAHSKTPLTCVLTSVIVVPALGKIAAVASPCFTINMMLLVIAAGFTLSVTVIWRLAPADSPAKPVASFQERRRLRLLSVIAACCAMIIQTALLLWAKAHTAALAIALGLWWQAFALTKAGHRLATLLDNIISRKEGEPDETFVL